MWLFGGAPQPVVLTRVVESPAPTLDEPAIDGVAQRDGSEAARIVCIGELAPVAEAAFHVGDITRANRGHERAELRLGGTRHGFMVQRDAIRFVVRA